MPRYTVVMALYDANVEFCDSSQEAENEFEAFVKAIMAHTTFQDWRACEYVEKNTYDAVVIGEDGTRRTMPFGAPYTIVYHLNNTLNRLKAFRQSRLEVDAALGGIDAASIDALTQRLQALDDPLNRTIEVIQREHDLLKQSWELRCSAPPPPPPPPPVEMPEGREQRVISLGGEAAPANPFMSVPPAPAPSQEIPDFWGAVPMPQPRSYIPPTPPTHRPPTQRVWPSGQPGPTRGGDGF